MKFGPVATRVRIHSGLRSMGVWELRTSSRNIFRGPDGSWLGATVTPPTLRRTGDGVGRM
ncbi:hypothetical protein GCM10023203_46750 [Actinomycetospora straminea]|uniref:Uncharacterized protein n=1 Tax=Actinomycetospora straminea TaxID=663607 RepID=A0ABP9EVE1_9PSEU